MGLQTIINGEVYEVQGNEFVRHRRIDNGEYVCESIGTFRSLNSLGLFHLGELPKDPVLTKMAQTIQALLN